MSEVGVWIEASRRGDSKAASRLLPLVYAELRHLAARYMRAERSGQTIAPTELVHEAYLRLAGQEQISWQGRTHFFALAATSMRRILVERARRRLAEKHGGGAEKIQLDTVTILSPEKSRSLVALDHALDQLAELSPRQSRIVELKFFAGLTIDEIAEAEGIAPRTVKNDWSVARAWLHRELSRVK
jgi:RNA polymerase sigma factor (TIGR02999 family)